MERNAEGGDGTGALVARARGLWEALAAAPVSFGPSGGVRVVAAPDSALCPPSWVGIVVLGPGAIVTAPDQEAARRVRQAVRALPVGALTRTDAIEAVLPVAEVLGPATLAYLSREDFRPAPDGARTGGVRTYGARSVGQLAPGHGGLRALLAAVSRQEADESGIAEIDSPVFVAREGAAVVAAAGYRLWPASTAHLCVLTAAHRRGRGLARQVASAAVAHALAADLLPQWRARPPASRRVAAALGFRELGSQLGVKLS